ncbi:na-translocating NADH-quinone reductase Nqr2 subunit [Butyrivibrio sp. CAG:318]|jgi:electron transport complex protein RnfD|nr:na-translocating NADH-quinone reductase Nqr2 subunit [Butyrivibrio sp. CAG:318]
MNMLNVSSSPHVRDNSSTRRIMLDVCIALLPACIFGIVNFGMRALAVLVVSVITCVVSEYLFEHFMHRPITVGDLSAVVTGLLLGMNMPHTIPLWIVMLGSVFAIIVVKQLFGGLGQNFMNPALAARCFLLISFAGRMTSFTYDGVTGATPLALLKSGESVNVLSMFLGTTAGVIGETSTVAILVGALYLIIRKVITPLIPMVYLAVFSVFILLFGGHGFDMTYLAAELCGGGLMLGAFFMATDYVTSPVNTVGRIVYGIILGILTGLFRIFGNSAEGVSYAIIFSNILVPLIEKLTVPRAFGVVREKKSKEVS